MPAMTSSNDGPLLTGPVRAYKDHKAKFIVVETTKDNAAGSGLQFSRSICSASGKPA